jgi:hypothetical protein
VNHNTHTIEQVSREEYPYASLVNNRRIGLASQSTVVIVREQLATPA